MLIILSVMRYVFFPRASKAESALRRIAHRDRRMRVGTNESSRIWRQIDKSLILFTRIPKSMCFKIFALNCARNKRLSSLQDALDTRQTFDRLA